LELTLGVPCQALLILDADFPDDRLSVVLDALALPTTPPEEATAPGPQRIERVETLQALHDELDKHAWLRGRYILLPNVTDGGLGTLMRQGMQGKYKDMP
jgi:chromosome segregation protein